MEAVEKKLRGRFRYPFAILGATETLWERFWSKVDMSGGPEACWTWKGYTRRRMRGKRGKLQVGGRGSRFVSADRLALALHTDGNLTKKKHGVLLQCCHRCGNGDEPIFCVNPNHLYWGTQKQNEKDKKRKAAREIAAALAAPREVQPGNDPIRTDGPVSIGAVPPPTDSSIGSGFSHSPTSQAARAL